MARPQIDELDLAGFHTRAVASLAGGGGEGGPLVILLHGFSMRADDLSPFAVSMGLPAVFLFPEGRLEVPGDDRGGVPAPAGRAWWMIDVARRAARGEDRDLSAEQPAGLAEARAGLVGLIAEACQRWPGRPLFLGGFSQGAILSLDTVLRTSVRPAGLVLLSGGRVDGATVAPHFGRLRGLPVFQSHGTRDRELGFSAAEKLRDDLLSAGADLKWWPFDGVHEIPLVVLRQLKKFLRGTVTTPEEPRR